MKQLISSWRESLAFFLSSNLSQFLLVTLNAFKYMWLTLLSIWFELITIISLIVAAYFAYTPKAHTFISSGLFLFAYTSLFMLIIRAIRPSVDYKDINYFKSGRSIIYKIFSFLFIFIYYPFCFLYSHPTWEDNTLLIIAFTWLLMPIAKPSLEKQISIIFFGIVFINILLHYIPIGSYFIILKQDHVILILRRLILEFLMIDENLLFKSIGILGYFVSPFVIFLTLFIMDAQKTAIDYIKAFKRAFIMLIYNYPFCFIVYNLLRLFIISLYLFNHIYFIAILLLAGFILPMYNCFITNFYIKRIHDQFLLYYR